MLINLLDFVFSMLSFIKSFRHGNLFAEKKKEKKTKKNCRIVVHGKLA
jgi:hypothetical protein